jgi:hypothetical protein
MAGEDSERKVSLLRRVSVWALLGVPGVLAFSASVSVENAKTNVAGWLHFLGADHIPAALTNPGADAIIQVMSAIMGMLLGVATVIFTLSTRRLAERNRLLSEQLVGDKAARRRTASPPKPRRPSPGKR